MRRREAKPSTPPRSFHQGRAFLLIRGKRRPLPILRQGLRREEKKEKHGSPSDGDRQDRSMPEREAKAPLVANTKRYPAVPLPEKPALPPIHGGGYA